MSGLAAAIRVGMYGKSVLLLERHTVAGGLNSYYKVGKYTFDVGLHAVTNYVEKGVKGTPLTKIFRQLRIDRDSFGLCPQTQSRISFPETNLLFSNDFDQLRQSIADRFPNEVHNFDKFTVLAKTNKEYSKASARGEIQSFFNDPLLMEMLLCPLLYYGSATENDMEFGQFLILFNSIFLEGFARPYEGIKPIIHSLLKRAKEVGVERKMGLGVKKLGAESNRVAEIVLDNGSIVTADQILSSIGAPETQRLIHDSDRCRKSEENIGKLAFIESIAVLDQPPLDLGFEDTIVFFNRSHQVKYERPNDLVDYRSGIICSPNHYDYGDRSLKENIIRVTAQASEPMWRALSPEDYQKQKQLAFDRLLETAASVTPNTSVEKLKTSVKFRDVFSPTTVTRFTGRIGGAIYGAPIKSSDGRTEIENLFICGTDQGYLGIIGSMISGIAMANAHVLSAAS